jgi:hypothetical protein
MEDYEELDYNQNDYDGNNYIDDNDDFENDDYEDYEDEYEDDDDYEENIGNFQQSIKAWERVGFGTSNLPDSSGKKLKGIEDPIDRFKNSIISIALNFKNYINIDSSDIEILINNLSKLKYIHHKNPTGYVLGYIVTGGGKKINNKIIEKIKSDILPNISNIKLEDVIRYSRLWLVMYDNL